MAKRVQVADLADPEGRKVTARTVQTYVRPGEVQVQKPGRTTMEQLADALEDFEPGIKRSLAKMQEAYVESEIAAAQKARLENQMTFAEAVKSGVVPGGVSPWWVKEYRRMDGEVAMSQQYPLYLEEALAGSGLDSAEFATEAEAAKAYSDFVNKTRAQFLKDNNPNGNGDWFAGAEGVRSGIESAAGSRFLSGRIAANEEKFAAAVQSEIGAIISDENASVDEKVAKIRQLNADKLGRYGFGHSEFNKATTQALGAVALDLATEQDYEGARSALELADNIPTGTGRLGDIPAHAKAIAELRSRITAQEHGLITFSNSQEKHEWWRQTRGYSLRALNWQDENRDFIRSERERAKSERDLAREKDLALADATVEILANPGGNHDELLAELAKNDNTTGLVSGLMALRDKAINANIRITEDPVYVGVLQNDILSGRANPADVIAAAAEGRLSNSTVLRLVTDWHQVQRIENKKESWPTEIRKVMTDAATSVYSRTRRNDEFAGKNPALETLAIENSWELRRRFVDFMDKNPGVTEGQAIDEAIRLTEGILNRASLQTVTEEGEGRQFTPPATQNTLEEAARWNTPMNPADLNWLRQRPTRERIDTFNAKYGTPDAEHDRGRAEIILEQFGIGILEEGALREGPNLPSPSVRPQPPAPQRPETPRAGPGIDDFFLPN